jgi:hypothetical protein
MYDQSQKIGKPNNLRALGAKKKKPMQDSHNRLRACGGETLVSKL